MKSMENKAQAPLIDRLALYQTANSSPETIKRNFIVRTAEYELILDSLRNKKQGDPLQHELILGWRGSGKSTLLRRIQVGIDEEPGLKEAFIAIFPAGEQSTITRLSDLWYEVLRELMERFGQEIDLQRYDSFDTERNFTRYLFGHVIRLLQEARQRVVILLDNIDRIFENIGDDGHLLREMLINYNGIQIIGASTRMSEHFWQYDQPFFDFFRVHHLEGLTFDEVQRLLNHWSNEMNIPGLQDYALHHRGRVEAMRILTNGLPRPLLNFIQVLLFDSRLHGFDYLRKVLDQATPLYQERLGHLTAPQRMIVHEMAFGWEAVPTKVLAEKCRMESKLVASYLAQLERNGVVETVKTGKKNHLYRLKDRFFNMWLMVTQGKPGQKRRARFLSRFLETWYDRPGLESPANGIVYPHEGPSNVREAEVYYQVDEKEVIHALDDIERTDSVPNGLQEAERYYLQAIENGQAPAMKRLAVFYYITNQQPRQALSYFRKYLHGTSSFENAVVLLILEIWNGQFDDFDRKIEAILQAEEVKNLALLLKHLLYHEQKHLVLSLFTSEEHGPALREHYILLYYATLILCGETGDNLMLRIPPEVQKTVQEIIENVKAKQSFYSQPAG